MWQHRQEERDLKRAEMDLVKQKKQVQRLMKQYETKLSQKESEDALALHEKELALEQFRQKDLHRRKEDIKNKTQLALAGRQKLNETTKKYIKTENGLSWRYQKLMESLELNRGEVETLSKDFQDRLRAKEEEQLQLKKELADVAITLNMEAHKIKQAEAEGNRQLVHTNKVDIKDSLVQEDNLKVEEKGKSRAEHHYENSKRNLQHSIREKQSTTNAKLRQGGRNLLDVRSRMQQNAEMQRLINREAEDVELDMMKQEMESKGKVRTLAHYVARTVAREMAHV